MSRAHLVVLAAGKGVRMKSSVPKVLHRVAGRSVIEHVLRAAAPMRPASTIVVVGHMAERIRATLKGGPDLQIAVQEQQLGTAHALLQAEPLLAGAKGTLLVLSGDVPLLRPETLTRLLRVHQETRAALTVLTAVVDRPYGYGRIVRTQGRVVRIVEERDASPEQREIHEINSGIYTFDLEPLFDALRGIGPGGAQGEHPLPDLLAIYRRRQLPVESLVVESADEIRGINSRTELAEASRIVRQRKNEELMAAGVTIDDPATTYVDVDVVVGPDTVIHPGAMLEGRTTIGARCELHAGARIVDSTLGDDVTVNNYCVIIGSRLASGARVGPFAHLRPESELREGARIGSFVELKKAVLGAGSKANHLSYLGDATIGEQVNVGAGTITCNYDGWHKHRTIIADGAFIGSGVQLVAPVQIGRGAYVAAGSAVTDDVPAGALGIARSRQENKKGWVKNRKGS